MGLFKKAIVDMAIRLKENSKDISSKLCLLGGPEDRLNQINFCLWRRLEWIKLAEDNSHKWLF